MEEKLLKLIRKKQMAKRDKPEPPKAKMREEIEKATAEYLANGGKITRYEKWGKVTILKQNLDGDLVETDWFETEEAYKNSL